MVYHIYCITNKINNKSYVGLSSNISERWKNHVRDSQRKCSRYYLFQAAIAKYGGDNFSWQIIEEHNNLDDANEAEEFYISYLKSLTPNGYNILLGGNNKHPTHETKKKISDTLKKTSWFIGRQGPDHPVFGKKLTDKEKEKLRVMFSGENGAGVKLTTKQVVNIYNEYLNDKSSTAKSLARKYNMGHNTIRNILNKKSWKKETAHLPDVNLKDRAVGELFCLSKLTENIVRCIKKDIQVMKSNNERAISRKLAEKYNISQGLINNILYDINWKHVVV